MASIEITQQEIQDAILINNQSSMALLKSKGVPTIGIESQLKFDPMYEYSATEDLETRNIIYSWVLKDAN